MKYIYNLIDVEGMPTERVGVKAQNLAILKNKDPQLVPEAFVMDSEVSEFYLESAGEYPKGIEREISKTINLIEKKTKTYLSDTEKPLLLSLRISENNKSDGVINSILNIGMNDEAVMGLITKYGRHKFAYSTYCDFVYEFAINVLGVQRASLDKQTEAIFSSEKIAEYKFLEEKHLKELVILYKSVVFQETGAKFPEDPIDQLKYALDAIFDSWESKTARTYRKSKNIKDKGCGLIIQQMVFGNLGIGSGVGVVESRNSKDGLKGLFGEFMHEAQGPSLDKSNNDILDIKIVEERFNESYNRLKEICSGLEIINKNAVELDFVIEDGKLWILQIDRPALSAKSSVSVAADMLRNEIIAPEEAICGLDGERLDQVFYPEIDERSNKSVVFKGRHGSVGVSQGKLYFDYTRANETKEESKILIHESSDTIYPQNILNQFDGFICLKGSINGRLAKYARATGKPCIINCPDIEVDWTGRKLTSANQTTLSEGTLITLDADSCEVLIGDVFLFNPDIGANLKYIISTADQISRMETELITEKMETIADGKLVNLSNIGIYDLGSFFYDQEPRKLLLDQILKIGLTKFGNSRDELIKLLKNYSFNILKEVGDNRINLRLYNESLNSILPDEMEVIKIADKINVAEHDLMKYVETFRDENPEFGLKGAKLYLKHDSLFETQIRAIVEAVIDARKLSFANGSQVGVVISGVSSPAEAKVLSRKFESVLLEYNDNLDVEIKFVAEVDNAAFLFKIQEMAPYFSEICINLDRLTAATYGLSENDNIDYFDGTYDFNPFERFDFEFMGDLVMNSIRKYKEITKSTVAVYGRYTSNKPSIKFFEEAGVDKIYVTKNNSLRTKILAGQACLEKLN